MFCYQVSLYFTLLSRHIAPSTCCFAASVVQPNERRGLVIFQSRSADPCEYAFSRITCTSSTTLTCDCTPAHYPSV